MNKILQQAIAIRDAHSIGQNTAVVVGNALVDIANALENVMAAASAGSPGYATPQMVNALSGLQTSMAAVQQAVSDLNTAIDAGPQQEDIARINNALKAVEGNVTKVTSDFNTHAKKTNTELQTLKSNDQVQDRSIKDLEYETSALDNSVTGMTRDISALRNVITSNMEVISQKDAEQDRFIGAINGATFLTRVLASYISIVLKRADEVEMAVNIPFASDSSWGLISADLFKAISAALAYTQEAKEVYIPNLLSSVESLGKNVSDIRYKELPPLQDNLPVEFQEIVNGVKVGSGSTTEKGALVYDKKTNKILWKVMYPQNDKPTYFADAKLEKLAGTSPRLGVNYICGNRVFIGMHTGLFELHKTEII